MHVLKAIAFEIGVFVLGLIAGNVLYRLCADLIPSWRMDRSPDAAQGAGIVLGVIVVIVHLVVRAVRRRRRSVT